MSSGPKDRAHKTKLYKAFCEKYDEEPTRKEYAPGQRLVNPYSKHASEIFERARKEYND